MTGRLFVCSTCSRYAPPPSGQPTPGQRLHAACVRAAADMKADVVIRSVECLNGCLHPCMAALSTPGKSRIRLADLAIEDAAALIEATIAHAESELGRAEEEILPPALLRKLAGPAVPVTSAMALR